MSRRVAIFAILLTAATPVTPVRQFLSSLSPALRHKATIPFNDPERFNWHYVPRSRRGVTLGELSSAQRELLHGMLRAGLSESGYRKSTGIIALEPILGRLEGSSFRDPDRYYVSIFGDPEQMPWSWRFEGHHLSINATYAPNGASLTPMFLGANPARTAGVAPVLDQEESLGRALLLSLNAAQRGRATINVRAPSDIVTGTDRRLRLEKFEGLPASEMTAEQRQQLLRLVQTYVGNASAEIAAAELTKIRAAGFEKLHFAWAGGDRPRQPHYYRVHGPTILIEYDNTQSGANHIHTVWRNPGGDFGDDLLAKHYAQTSHHRRARARFTDPAARR